MGPIIISVVNQKGGVGKTTSTLNIASSLALIGKNILLIDLDPQGNASSGLGLSKAETKKSSIYQALTEEKEISDCLYKTTIPNLYLCPSDTNLVGAEIELVGEYARESKLKNILERIGKKGREFDLIFIDCPPSLGLLTINALNASDYYLVPTQAEFFAMEGLAQLTNTIKIVKKSLNPKLELLGILLTMFDKRANLHRQVAKELNSFFAGKVFKTLIPRSIKLSEAPSFGLPILLYDKNSSGSLAYIDLSLEILKSLDLYERSFSHYKIRKNLKQVEEQLAH